MSDLRMALLILGGLVVVGVIIWGQLRRGRPTVQKIRRFHRVGEQGGLGARTPSADGLSARELSDSNLSVKAERDTPVVVDEELDQLSELVAHTRDADAIVAGSMPHLNDDIEEPGEATSIDKTLRANDGLDSEADQSGPLETEQDGQHGDAAAFTADTPPAEGWRVDDPEPVLETPAADSLIVALNIAAPADTSFTGQQILDAMQAIGARHGDMQIFHHYGSGPLSTSAAVFSIANMLEPGIFVLDAMDSLTTRGLVVFMHLPGELDNRVALELMLNTAQQLAGHLGGQLLDEAHEPLDAEAIELLRERVSRLSGQTASA